MVSVQPIPNSKSFLINFSPSSEYDVEFYRIHATHSSQFTNGDFTPSLSNLISEGPDTVVTFTAPLAGTWGVKIGAVDTFGPDLVNYSGLYTVIVQAPVDELLAELADQITDSELHSSLTNRIDLIDTPTTGLVSLVAGHTGAINSINSQLADISTTPAYSGTETYSKSDMVTYNGGLYCALQTTTGNLPTNVAYWEKVGDYTSLGEAVAAQAVILNDHETRIDTAEGDIVAEVTTRETLATQLRGSYTGTVLDSLTSGLLYSERTARSTADGTQVTRLEGLEATAGDTTAAIQIEQMVRATTTGPNWNITATYAAGNVVVYAAALYQCILGHTNKTPPNATYWKPVTCSLYAQYVIKLDVNGKVSGFGMVNDGSSSSFEIVADRFAICNTSGAGTKYPFIVDGTFGVIMDVALIKNLTATNIAANSISADRIKTNELIVGDNIAMGAGAYIGWDHVSNKQGASTNLLINSDFPNGSSDQWAATSVGITGITFGMDLDSTWTLVGGHTAYISDPNVPVSGSYSEYVSAHICVEGEKTYEFFAHMGLHRANAWLFMYWYDSAGTCISATGFVSVAFGLVGGKLLSTYGKAGGFVQAPANAATGRLSIRKTTTTTGETNSYLFFTRAFVGLAVAGQTILSEWTPSASSIRALGVNPTYIDANGIYTGNLSADQITTGVLNAGRINLTTVSGYTYQYTTPGIYTLTVPTDCTGCRIKLWGGGGGGGRGETLSTGGTGGGGGGTTVAEYTNAVPGSTLTITVGAAGAYHITGGTSSVTGTNISNYAYGGGGGKSDVNTTLCSDPCTGCGGGTIGNFAGGAGGAGTYVGSAGTFNQWYVSTHEDCGETACSCVNDYYWVYSYREGGISGAIPGYISSAYGHGGKSIDNSGATHGAAIVELFNPNGVIQRAEWNAMKTAVNAHGITWVYP